ncbi:hypothetical protein GOBAR_DD30105 [Gossypium barbadense]|nr:hypothetical protein GOBAR_DD30105 [Gossypium barbadense]
MGEDQGICWFGDIDPNPITKLERLSWNTDSLIKWKIIWLPEYILRNTRRAMEEYYKGPKEVNHVSIYNQSIIVNQPRKVVANQQGSLRQESEVKPGGNQGKTMSHGEFHYEKGSETQESVEGKALVQGIMDDRR